jgi:preprotein translocase subunit SecE
MNLFSGLKFGYNSLSKPSFKKLMVVSFSVFIVSCFTAMFVLGLDSLFVFLISLFV